MNALEMAQYIAYSSYTDEFCAVCGCAIKIDAPKTDVWTEVCGSRVSRPAHAECSQKQIPENFSAKYH